MQKNSVFYLEDSEKPKGSSNTSDFDTMLAELTQKHNPKVHGVIMKCVDKNGTLLLSPQSLV